MIELGENQSAEPNHCGSCRFFNHRQPEYDTNGVCRLDLPPWLFKRLVPVDFEVDPRTVRDMDSCSFYQPRTENGQPAVFTQRQYWKAGSDLKSSEKKGG